jgi:hypothetical protein
MLDKHMKLQEVQSVPAWFSIKYTEHSTAQWKCAASDGTVVVYCVTMDRTEQGSFLRTSFTLST